MVGLVGLPLPFIAFIYLLLLLSSLHTSSSFERMQAHACIVRPGGRLGFALLVLFVRALLILAHEVIADVMMTVIDYRPYYFLK